MMQQSVLFLIYSVCTPNIDVRLIRKCLLVLKIQDKGYFHQSQQEAVNNSEILFQNNNTKYNFSGFKFYVG